MAKVSGFDVYGMTNYISESFKEYYLEARIELINELSSPGYSHIIQTFTVSPDMQDLSIILNDDILPTQQDVFQLLAKGGALKKKDGTFLKIMPSYIVNKYLGK